MDKKIRSLTVGLLMLAAVVFMSSPAYAYVQPMWIEVNQLYHMEQDSGITRISIANPKIADVRVLDKTTINVLGLAPGSTGFSIWTEDGMRQDFDITVSPVDSGMAKNIEKAIGLSGVKVFLIDNGKNRRILLRGTVVNQAEKDLAQKIAELYTGGSSEKSSSSDSSGTAVQNKDSRKIFKDNGNVQTDDSEENSGNVVNMLEMTNPDQINIESMIIEINSDEADKLGATYASMSSDGTTLSDPGTFYAGESYGSQRDAGSHWYNSNWLFTHFSKINAQIHALIENGKARIISRPNITTMSGKTAGIHVGGKILVPSTSTQGSISYEEKNYGIELDLVKPVTDKDGNITSTLYTSVSRLDYNNGLTVSGTFVPGIADRTATSVVNIPTGMTMAIAGLINSEETEVVKKVPILGNIPILGELFKYHNKSRQKSEIMILITPRVVNENTPVEMSNGMKKAYTEEKAGREKNSKVDLNKPIEQPAVKVPASTSSVKKGK